MSKEYLAKVEVISYCGTKQITLVNDALATTCYCSDLLCYNLLYTNQNYWQFYIR